MQERINSEQKPGNVFVSFLFKAYKIFLNKKINKRENFIRFIVHYTNIKSSCNKAIISHCSKGDTTQ